MRNTNILTAIIAAILVALVSCGFYQNDARVAQIVSGYELVGCGADWDNEGCVVRTPEHQLFFTSIYFKDDADLQHTVRSFVEAGLDVQAQMASSAYQFHLDSLRYVGEMNIEVFATAGLLAGQDSDYPYTVSAERGGLLHSF